MVTTKEQELKALAQIRKIVDGLGENSWVGAAFTGCLEDAEQNIEEDAAYSYYDRFTALLGDIDTLMMERDELKKRIAELEKKELSNDDLLDIKWIVQRRISEEIDRFHRGEAAILENADDPDSEAFKVAVRDRKVAKMNHEAFQKMFERLVKITKDM